MRIVDQTQNFQGMFQVLHFIFFGQQGGGVPKTIKKLKIFEFFVDCSIIDAKLIILTPTYGTWCIQKGVHLQLGIFS